MRLARYIDSRLPEAVPGRGVPVNCVIRVVFRKKKKKKKCIITSSPLAVNFISSIFSFERKEIVIH